MLVAFYFLPSSAVLFGHLQSLILTQVMMFPSPSLQQNSTVVVSDKPSFGCVFRRHCRVISRPLICSSGQKARRSRVARTNNCWPKEPRESESIALMVHSVLKNSGVHMFNRFIFCFISCHREGGCSLVPRVGLKAGKTIYCSREVPVPVEFRVGRSAQ